MFRINSSIRPFANEFEFVSILRGDIAVLRRGGKFARTHYRVLDNVEDLISLVECRLETGRTHQIRVHMTSIGHSIVGDPVYGGVRKLSAMTSQVICDQLANVTSQILHARLLGFVHPITEEYLVFHSKKHSKHLLQYYPWIILFGSKY